jgi:hypothetical protein
LENSCYEISKDHCLIFYRYTLTVAIVAFAKTNRNDQGYIIEQEKNIAKQEPGPHNGGGLTTSIFFF